MHKIWPHTSSVAVLMAKDFTEDRRRWTITSKSGQIYQQQNVLDQHDTDTNKESWSTRQWSPTFRHEDGID